MERPDRPWLVRIEGKQRNEVFGAGTLLDETHVLTCAHVVGGSESEVLVRIRGRPERTYTATVAEGCWFPPSPYRQMGDIAILRLAEPAAGAPRARLRRDWRPGERISCFGFRAGAQDQGLTAEARVQDYDLDGERVQLDPLSSPRIAKGFSGSAALTPDGEICGMVVTADLGAQEASWMIDVRALLKHAGRTLGPYLIVGAPPDDRQFTDPRSQPAGPWGPAHTALLRALSGWLGSDDLGGVAVACGTTAAAVLTRLVGPTVRAYRERIGEPDPHATLPLGSVQAAVDATGKTADEVASAIARGLDLPADDYGVDLLGGLAALGPPVTIVVNCVDRAAEPRELREEVILPIALRARVLRVRLLLGFTSEPWDDLRDAVVAGAGKTAPKRLPRGPASRERLRMLVGSVAAAESRAAKWYNHVSLRILHLPRLRPPAAAALRVRLALLGAETHTARYAGASAALRRQSKAAIGRADGFATRLKELVGERDQLRELLSGYHAYAQKRAYERDGRALEDPELSTLYNKAHVALYGGLVDLERARRRVDRYAAAARLRFPEQTP